MKLGGRILRGHKSLLLAQVFTLAIVPPALAQEPPAAAPADTSSGVLVYPPDYFASASPNTALDMINRLPGFTLDGGDQVRGFAGAAGNVLIDGQRPTIKTDSLQDALNRIPVSQVERIELIRGGAPGVDMQGRTVLANVVRKRIDTFQQVVQANALMFAGTGRTLPGWSYEAHRRAGEHQIDFQMGRGISYDDSVGFGHRTTLDVASGVETHQKDYAESDGFAHSARLNYKGPLAGGVLSANGLASTDEFKDETRYYSATTNDRFLSRSANDRYEIGLNYLRPVMDKLEAEVIGLSKYTEGSGINTGDSGGSKSRFGGEVASGESIGRAILRYTPASSLKIESGGEIAYNYRKQQSALSVNGTPIALPASNVKVEETRGEGFIQGTWRALSTLSVEAGVRYEKSTISQSGDTSKERSFTYPKPRLAATWSPTANRQVRMRIERKVGQLNFQDFASAVDLSGNARLSAGNAELRPDKTWIYELAFEQRFWETGAVVLTLRHEDITDAIDRLPFLVLADANGDGVPDDANNDGVPDQRLVVGPGNIGDGKNDVIQLVATLPTKPFGLEGGEFKINAIWQNSEVADPLTQEPRRISSQRPDNVRVSYRQDLPDWKLTAGFTWYAGWSERRYFLEEIQRLDLKNFYALFAEYKPWPNLTVRAELNNLDPYSFVIQREFYSGRRDQNPLRTIQTENRHSQVIGGLSVRWTFN